MIRYLQNLNFGQSVRLGLYLCIFWGYLALLHTMKVNPSTMIIGTITLFSSIFLTHRLSRFSKSMWNFIAFLGACAFVYDGFVAKDPIEAALKLIFVVQLYKLFNLNRKRDCFQILAMVFFQVMIASLYSSSYLFGLIFIGFLYLGTITLMLVAARSDLEKVFATKKGVERVEAVEIALNKTPSLFSPAFFKLTSISFFVLLVINILFFLFIPRTNMYLVRGLQDLNSAEEMSGFDEEIQLGDIGDIKTNPRKVMVVEMAAKLTHPMFRWRGLALDEFDGQIWKVSASSSRTFSDEDYDIRNARFSQGNRYLSSTPARIYLDPGISRYLFLPNWPVGVSFLKGPRHARVNYDIRTVQLENPPSDVFAYSADFVEPQSPREVEEFDELYTPETIMRVCPPQSEPQEYIGYFKTIYLQLPFSEEEKARLATLADEMMGDAKDLKDRLLAMESFFQEKFTYTTQVQDEGSSEPITDFLFKTRTGHCEYFASSMALLLRSKNIAARVVNGYLPGEWDDETRSYTVRQSDAHSWVEVCLPRQGWVTFDPTPASGRELTIKTSELSWWVRAKEAIERRWNRFVVNYDSLLQRNLYASLREKLQPVVDSIHGLMDASNGTLFQRVLYFLKAIAGPVTKFILIPIAILFLLIFLFRKWRTTSLIRKGDYRRQATIAFYESLLKSLRKRGVTPLPGETAREFSTRIANGSDTASDLNVLVNAYYHCRFGNYRPTLEELRKWEDLVRRISTESMSKN